MPLDQETVVRHLLRDRAKVVGYIRGIVGDAHLAEDVFQNLTILAMHKHAEIADEDHLPLWIRRSARFEALNLLRKRGRSPLMIDSAVVERLDDHWAAYDHRTGGEMMDALHTCMDTLTPNARRMVELRYLQNLTSAQVAKELQRKAATVYQALMRIRQTLAECVRRRTLDEGVTRA
ncbi:MAG: sigma-70 family RNA polymerase sigma factor [Phycisphaera sp.]|nr:sigma-70 family RNA polymerase sigma factor [Phycisphaera sp.]